MNLTEYLGNKALVAQSKAVTLALRHMALVLQPEEAKVAACGLLGVAVEWLKQEGVTDDELRSLLDLTLSTLADASKLVARAGLEVVK